LIYLSNYVDSPTGQDEENVNGDKLDSSEEPLFLSILVLGPRPPEPEVSCEPDSETYDVEICGELLVSEVEELP